MKEIKFSIIVPVYNADKYISRCIDSLLELEYPAYEIIIINDGSTDTTLSIVQKYANCHERIACATQQNMGAGATRNRGISIAQGDYILFVDGDDSVDHMLTKKCYERIVNQNYDMVMFEYNQVSETGKVVTSKTFATLSDDGFLLGCDTQQLLFNRGYFSVIAAYRRNFLIKNAIRFSNEKVIYEDQMFTIDAIICADSIAIIKQPLYFYYFIADSTSHVDNTESLKYRLDCRRKSLEEMKNVLCHRNASPVAVSAVIGHEFLDLCYAYWVPSVPEAYRHDYLISIVDWLAGFTDFDISLLKSDLQYLYEQNIIYNKNYFLVADKILISRVEGLTKQLNSLRNEFEKNQNAQKKIVLQKSKKRSNIAVRGIRKIINCIRKGKR
jgi:glycosyltransferase involved in cell wall biosynthesis